MEITTTNIFAFTTEETKIAHCKITFPGKFRETAARRIIKEAYPTATFVSLAYSNETFAPENLPKMVKFAEVDLNK